MPHSITDEAIVLKTYNVGEADKFCILLLREHGKLSARAFGSRKLLSRKRGLLPCHRVLVTLSHRSSGYAVQTVRCLDSASHAWMEAPSFASASSALELVLRMTEEGAPMPDVYDLCREFLEEAIRIPADRMIPLFTLKLLGLLGSLPSLTLSCVSARPLQSTVVFSERLGGLCFPDEDRSGVRLSSDCSRILRALERSPLASLTAINPSVLLEMKAISQGVLGSQLGISLTSLVVASSLAG